MYYQVASRQVVVYGIAVYSQAIDMAGANQVRIDLELCNIIGSVAKAATFTLQQSNDLENWVDVVSSPSMESPGYFTLQTSEGLGCRFVRLKYAVTGIDGDTAVLSAGIETADL